MSDDEKTWANACERIGVWKRGERCSGMDPDGHYFTGKEIDGEPEMVSHDIPCPPIGEPAATLKMLEWLWERKRISLTEEGLFISDSEEEDGQWFTGSLPLALAAAVNALSESQVK